MEKPTAAPWTAGILRKRMAVLALLALMLGACGGGKTRPGRFLAVSANGRYLEDAAGKPFLYLGCTAWELFHRLSREEASEYLKNRKEKGFTVIQAVVLAENDGLRTPNAYGALPLHDLDPARPNEAYFEHVDFIVNQAEALGLYIGMLPAWGDKIPNENPAAGPIVFTIENAREYGEFLGKRYQDKPVIWILGGDRNVHSDTAFLIWKSMAEGLRAGDGGNHLISMHPRGERSSSEWFHNEPWFDFNLYQSGHARRYNEVYRYAQHDYSLQPAKPAIDGEPAYEDIAVRFWEYCDWSDPLRVPPQVLDSNKLIQDPAYFTRGFIGAHDVRVHAYWNLLAGAAGYTYGNNAIWQMFRKGGDIAIPCLYDWRESMDRPGADDIRHVRKLFEARDFSKLLPDQSAVYGHNPADSTHIRAAVAGDGSFLLVYLSVGQPVRVVMSKISGARVRAAWYDPREGTTKPAGEFANSGFAAFTPPSSGPGHDWLLVLDDAARTDGF
ncbi:MAG: glycoside hydrolase family 140 protein [Bacteroidia bacterium]|nr:glycoside hydrolase family 140 protein [Bacteroidia bacterium]